MVMSSITLAPLDLGIVALFIAAIFALGFSARVRNNSLLQFFAAGRSLSLPVFVATLVSTWYGGILGIGESVSYYGVGTWVLMGVPYYVFALGYAFWFAPRVRGAEQITIPERLELKFGRSAALVGAILVFLLAVPAAHVLMIGVLVSAISGLPQLASVLVGAAIGLSFLYRGGLLADARVSLLAFAMMFVGFGAVVGYCVFNYPLGEMWSGLTPQQRSWNGGTSSPYVLSFLILGAWTLVDPGFHQRVASSISPEIGRRGVLVSVLFWMLFDLLSITTGLYALGLLKETPADPLLIFPALAEAVMPPGLKAIFLCGMFGTILSAMVGYTLVAGESIGKEIYGRIQGGGSPEQATRWTRIGLFLSIGIAALLAHQIASVVGLWYSWAGAVVGALLIPTALAYRDAEFTGRTAVAWSMGLAFAVSIVLLVYGKTSGNDYLEVALLRSAGGLSLVWPSGDPAQAALLEGSDKFSLGTLLPGLAVSGLVLGTAAIWMRKR